MKVISMDLRCLVGPVSVFCVTVAVLFGRCNGLSFFSKTTPEELEVKVFNETPPVPLNTLDSFVHTQRIHLDGKKLKDCPDMSIDMDSLTQNQFSKLLTNDCRYDKLTKPHTIPGKALNVTAKIDIKHIEAIEQLQFRMDMIVQYRYMDHRLNYQALSPNRGPMVGRETLTSRIWIPHLVISNERNTRMMGFEGKDQFIFISPQGEITYSFRMSAIVYCWMNLKKFPFDKQICNVNLQSWTYNATEMMLYWEAKEPAKVVSQLHLTEFLLEDFWTYAVHIQAPILAGNYSGLVFKFRVAREVGFYIMDYFIPSIMLVCTSWVTFWLQADNGAPRTTLGTSTMLSFITLASAQSKNLPKVSYIKVSEIWFLACAMFIFASMVEFAFVNIIWRRRKQVELKKVNGKYIFKSTIVPSLARKELHGSNQVYDSTGTLNGLSSATTLPEDSNTDCPKLAEIESGHKEEIVQKTWTTMTPQEVANWIDKRARVAFPLAFLTFNVFFWLFVFYL